MGPPVGPALQGGAGLGNVAVWKGQPRPEAWEHLPRSTRPALISESVHVTDFSKF